MILLLGNTGYIGSAFQNALKQRGIPHVGLSRTETDYTNFNNLLRILHKTKPDFLINAAGYTGKPNVDKCETAWAETLQGNALFAATVAHACHATQIPFGHVSSGCIYTGAKVQNMLTTTIEPNFNAPHIQKILTNNPEKLIGFTETDPPNFCFRSKPCSFYSGTKALGEEALAFSNTSFIWRLRIPFDEQDNPRNYLTKLQTYKKFTIA